VDKTLSALLNQKLGVITAARLQKKEALDIAQLTGDLERQN